ncbi:hypothetical protein SGFS_062930 [Streptomyces graminofaciens]|uniref:Uncharacterized protein n=1 Tax=Streptomyces graminofaciens TaxID=68212 RepID=A0ABN5VNF7_9ACTN|nr:hypothetical protein [Streptomyces graminofaciens]BBC34999.1 hypothetical protein SGFS_062930 [Streptomyces graminofaciens]
MHSVRILLATAAASAALALGASGAYAAGGDWDHSDSSYSKEQGKEHGKGYEKEHGKEHDKGGRPHGGMHTGGGALTAVDEGGWGSAKDSEGYNKDSEHGKESGGKHDESSWSGKDENSWSGKHHEDSYGGKHEKPSGGIHTGGGALASPTVTAGGLAVLAIGAAGLYAGRRKRAAGSLA